MEEINLLDKFIQSKSRNQWLTSKRLSIYVRKAIHYIDNKPVKTLDIANISVTLEYSGKGLGMQFIKEAHKVNPFDATFIENVLNSSFENKLKVDGWVDIPSDISPKSFYKKVNKNV